MSLNLAMVGYQTEPHEFNYNWKNVVLYGLGIGAKREELDYLLESRGPQVFPSFAVIPPNSVIEELLGKSGGDFRMVVHLSQVVRLLSPIPPEGTLTTRGTIQGIYDLKRFAQMVMTTQTSVGGVPCFETEFAVIYRDGGGCGGGSPPKRDLPKIPKDTEPSFVQRDVTSPEQALLYRLSGDLNPLHADPEVAQSVGFPEGPILHGLCTFGFMTRAVLRAGPGRPIVELGAQFKKPVWPGDTLVTQGYQQGEDTVVLQTFAEGRPDAVLTGWAKQGPALR